jgi:hypothetical protein
MEPVETITITLEQEDPLVVAARKVNAATCNTRCRKQKKREGALAVAGHLVPRPPKRVNWRVPVVQSPPPGRQLYLPYYYAAPQLYMQQQSAYTVTDNHQVSFNVDLNGDDYTFMKPQS